MEHSFTKTIKEILKKHFASASTDVFDKSQLLQYINIKTKSANKGAKARGSFANLYAIYVVVEDYLANNFHKKGNYAKYEGAEFNKLFKRQRELPFGAKLQNHALNNRVNSEFQGFFRNSDYMPIIRNLETARYWINENLIKIKVSGKTYNIAKAIVEIIEEYAKTKKSAFEQFLQTCLELQEIQNKNPKEVESFIFGLLAPNVDARLFEIVSYSILKYFYHDQKIYWGFEVNKLQKENLILYKTGRTNANDGGIDFVMKPLGRFFQVTETLNVKKYFLDIDKIHRYPITSITFVIKSVDTEKKLVEGIKNNALRVYSIKAVVDRYMRCIEEIINIPRLHKCFIEAEKQGYLKNILDEIILQSKVEFNQDDDDDENGEDN
ncbi:MAG: restriction endonuclease [Sedimentisphaerales bacterium]|jgi:hypothetical protein